VGSKNLHFKQALRWFLWRHSSLRTTTGAYTLWFRRQMKKVQTEDQEQKIKLVCVDKLFSSFKITECIIFCRICKGIINQWYIMFLRGKGFFVVVVVLFCFLIWTDWTRKRGRRNWQLQFAVYYQGSRVIRTDGGKEGSTNSFILSSVSTWNPVNLLQAQNHFDT